MNLDEKSGIFPDVISMGEMKNEKNCIFGHENERKALYWKIEHFSLNHWLNLCVFFGFFSSVFQHCIE
jgi:hypothetical protein